MVMIHQLTETETAASPYKVGYARVSTAQQSLQLQIDALQSAGCQQIYIRRWLAERKLNDRNWNRWWSNCATVMYLMMAKGIQFPIQGGRYIGSIKNHLSPESHIARKIIHYYSTDSQLPQSI